MLCEFHNSEPRDTRDFGNIGGHRYIVAVLECLEHLRKCRGTTFVVKAPIMRARAADRADIQPFGSTRIDLPVAVAGDQHFSAMSGIVAFNERRHEMLTVPHRHNRRHISFVVDVASLQGRSASSPNESKVPSGHYADGLLKGW